MEPLGFAVLGPVRVRREDTELPLGGPQERALLALLLARAGEPVAVGEIVTVLWGRRPPTSAVNVIRRHVGSLRRLLEPGLPTRAVGRWLLRDAGGYRLAVDGACLDLLRFRLLRDTARRAAAEASPARVVELLTEALALWRGPVASGVPEEVRERAGFGSVDRERLAAVREAADAALQVGLPEAVLPELQEAAVRSPLDEPVLARLILALAATGRRSEALSTYRAVCSRLADELGIDPSPELRDAHQATLRDPYDSSRHAHETVPHDSRTTVLHDPHKTVLRNTHKTLNTHTTTQRDTSSPAAGTVSTRTVANTSPAGTRYAPAPDNTPTVSFGSANPSGTVSTIGSTAATAPARDNCVQPTAPRPPASPPPPPKPAQLPHDLPTFVGRRTELDEVLALLAGDDGPPAETVVISAIGGMAGIGKTTLAVHWAHRVADRFPDGQLYVNLRGFDPSGAVLGAGEAVRVFLDALGVPPDRVPHGVDAQAALYRSLLAGRRFLVLLDNARDTAQVRPLLPGTSGCLTIVTSRNQLSGLVSTHGAHSLTLRPLDAGQAREFLARRLGAQRLAGESGAVAEITTLCAGLPLALACVAARAAAHPGFPLSAVAAELRAAHGSLVAFSRTDPATDVSAVFSWSTGAVTSDAARLFRLLALHPGPDFSIPATAALAGVPAARARRLLAELADVHLLGERAPGRYAFHDLLRAHAAELLGAHHPESERRSALDRLYAYYLHTAHAAGLLLAPHADPMPPGRPPAGVVPDPLADDQQALAWLAAEYPVLLAVIDAAAQSGHDSDDRQHNHNRDHDHDHDHDDKHHSHEGQNHDGHNGHESHTSTACLLAWSLEPFFDRRGHWHDWVSVQRTALECARRHRQADPAWEAHGLRALARAEGRLGLHERSRPRLDRALELFTALGDAIGRANTHRSLGWTCDQQGDLAGALRHNQLALQLFEECDHRAAQASVLNSVGWYLAQTGEYRQALSHCFRALTMLQDLGDRYGEATTWDSIAYAHHHLGRHPHALLGYRNALALYRDLGVPYLEASTLIHIGDTHLATGDHEDARAAWQQALTILVALGHPDADEVRDRLREQSERRGLA
ncbi:BTAD domain-containing putative transcriptional regulator [Streptomyces cavernae]|uniref:BTAD domain-containing putative transcriptional regulator n=1 Tax=Streptomyces cavernae TaxID=2259034 RepID=UPI000FEB812B